MSSGGVDEILTYRRNPDEDFYAMLNCDENSTVSSMCCAKCVSLYECVIIGEYPLGIAQPRLDSMNQAEFLIIILQSTL